MYGGRRYISLYITKDRLVEFLILRYSYIVIEIFFRGKYYEKI